MLKFCEEWYLTEFLFNVELFQLLKSEKTELLKKHANLVILQFFEIIE